jgi:iron complex outermembrane receptor protein
MTFPGFPRRIRVTRRAWLFALAGFSPTVLMAADPAPATEDLYLNRLPVVLSATRMQQPLAEAPASITVIDRKMIEASGAVNITDLFRLVPGMQVGHNTGTRTIVTYHGLSDSYSRRMQVLVDGRSVYSTFFGGVDWPDLPLAIEDIDRIEVIRGPNGPAYGANSFSAVINIITRHPAQDHGTTVNLVHGERGTERVFVRHGDSTGDFTYRVSIGYREDDGFPGLRDSLRVPMITFRGEQRLDRQNTLDILFGWTGGNYDDGIEGSSTDPARKRDNLSHFEQVRWRRALNANDEVSLNYYHNYFRWSDNYLYSVLSVSESFKTERHNLEFQHNLKAAADKRVVWGAEVRLDRVQGQTWFGTADWLDTRLFRLFGNLEWRFRPDWILNAGLMYEHNSITEGDYSPRLALNHHFAPGQTVRASATRAYRTPSMLEHRPDFALRSATGTVLNQFFLARGSLMPERMTAYEIGYLGEFPGAQLIVDTKIFREQVRRLISDTTFTAADSYSYFINDGATDTDGVELQLRWRPWTQTQLIYGHGYAHQRGKLVSESSPTTWIDTAGFTPVHTRSLMAIQELPGNVSLSAVYYKTSSFRFGGGNPTGDFNTLDARLARKWRSGQLRGEVALIGQHLTGDYYTFRSNMTFDKRYFLNLNLRVH